METYKQVYLNEYFQAVVPNAVGEATERNDWMKLCTAAMATGCFDAEELASWSYGDYEDNLYQIRSFKKMASNCSYGEQWLLKLLRNAGLSFSEFMKQKGK